MAPRVCLIVTDAISFNVLYRGQLEYLVAEGFELTLICGGSVDEINSLRARNVGRVIDLGLVRAPSLWTDTVSLMRLFLHLCFNRYDLVLSSTPKALLLGSFAACMTLQRRRAAFFQGRVYENFRGVRRKMYRFLDRVTVACVHEVLFVSRSLMSEFVDEIPAAGPKGRVLGDGSGNGICHRTFSRESVPSERIVATKHELGLSSSDFVVLVVGRICADKGLKEIAQVADRLDGSNAKILLVGRPEGDAAVADLERLVAKGLVRHVPFTADVVSYFAIAHVHLFLSHREGFGNVAIEAAAMGVPTVAFDVVGVRDSVADGVSGIRIAFGDIDTVVKTLQEMMGQAEKTEKNFRTARQWALEKFSSEQVWARYTEFYRGAKSANESGMSST